MLSHLLTVISSFVLLASAKECIPGQNCELRCCTLPEGDVLCRERCLGLSCERDVHCGGDCCVNATCSSCLMKRLSLTRPSDALNSSQPSPESGETPSTTPVKTVDRQGGFEEKTSNTRTEQVKAGCSQLKNDCSSGCCIHGRCVNRSQCKPVKAARGGRRSGGGRTSGGGGGGGAADWPIWAWVLFGIGIFLSLCGCFIKLCCYFTQ